MRPVVVSVLTILFKWILRIDDGVDAAADKEVPFDRHLARFAGSDQIIQNLQRHLFVKPPLVAVAPDVQLQRL